MKRMSSFVLSFLIVLFSVQCTFSTTLPLEPKFNAAKMPALQDSCRSLFSCKEFKMQGSVQNKNGIKTSTLNIIVTNPEGLSADTAYVFDHIKRVALNAKSAVENQYDYFKVTLRYDTVINGISSRNDESYAFKSSELQ